MSLKCPDDSLTIRLRQNLLPLIISLDIETNALCIGRAFLNDTALFAQVFKMFDPCASLSECSVVLEPFI